MNMVKTVLVPYDGKSSRFTLTFVRLAIDVFAATLALNEI